ncbi:hypothetical protein MTO96_048786 [Rhipicephalus appendiculatus]
MKYSSAVLLCALLAAFLVLTTAAEESLEEEGRRSPVTGSGCPDISACIYSCKRKGQRSGICFPKSRWRSCVCVSS